VLHTEDEGEAPFFVDIIHEPEVFRFDTGRVNVEEVLIPFQFAVLYLDVILIHDVSERFRSHCFAPRILLHEGP